MIPIWKAVFPPELIPSFISLRRVAKSIRKILTMMKKL